MTEPTDGRFHVRGGGDRAGSGRVEGPTRPTSVVDRIRWDGAGLVPTVVQDASDGTVLMVAWADREAVEATLRTGEVHFHSRTRGRLWRKGEESGNVLRLLSLALDCDGDTLLVTADPAGPTCHTGARTCFDGDGTAPCWPPPRGEEPGAAGLAWLDDLVRTIDRRARERPPGSYTVALLAGGVDASARKVAEEATEVLMAAKDDAVAEAARPSTDREATRAALAGEAADLLYHLLVLLRERDLPPGRVIDVLRERHGG